MYQMTISISAENYAEEEKAMEELDRFLDEWIDRHPHGEFMAMSWGFKRVTAESETEVRK